MQSKITIQPYAENPSLCVIIPTANRTDLLKEALDSVLAQSVLPDEIIIVDNGKQPATINDQSLKAIKIIRTAPCIGAAHARNIGAHAAHSEYISFLDDDDLWDSKYLEMVKEAIVFYNPDIVVARLMRMGLSNTTEDAQEYKLFPTSYSEQREVCFRNPGFGGQNITIRASLFAEIGGFDIKMPSSHDRDLAFRLLLANRVISVEPRAIAFLRDHDRRRERASIVVGNTMFLLKHVFNMRVSETAKCIAMLGKRTFQLIKKNFG